jgi:hypothetical protein
MEEASIAAEVVRKHVLAAGAISYDAMRSHYASSAVPDY